MDSCAKGKGHSVACATCQTAVLSIPEIRGLQNLSTWNVIISDHAT